MAKFLPESLLIIYFLYQVIFEGIVNGEKGDLAIDEVTFKRNQNCSFIPDSARSTYTAGKQNITIFRKGATSALAGFHAGPLPWLNWNLEILVFDKGGKQENPEKNPWSKTRNSTNI